MKAYRAYVLDEAGLAVRVALIEAGDDTAALKAAADIATDQSVELWRDGKYLSSIQPTRPSADPDTAPSGNSSLAMRLEAIVRELAKSGLRPGWDRPADAANHVTPKSSEPGKAA